MRYLLLLNLFVLTCATAIGQENAAPITAAEAMKKIDQKVSVAMDVKSTGGNTARYLNSEADFRGEKNFAVFIPHVALPAFQKAGVEDPGKFYFGKSIVVSGTVAVVQNRPQIRVENPSQIRIVNGGAPAAAVKRPGK